MIRGGHSNSKEVSERDRLKHGDKRRAWRKLHIAVDAGIGETLAHLLTGSDTSDGAMAGPLVVAARGRIRSVMADGAYDGTCHGGTERERHAAEIAAHGRMAGQKTNGHGKRALVETAVLRLKHPGGDRITARSFGAQQKEICVRVSAANKAIRHANPVTVQLA